MSLIEEAKKAVAEENAAAEKRRTQAAGHRQIVLDYLATLLPVEDGFEISVNLDSESDYNIIYALRRLALVSVIPTDRREPMVIWTPRDNKGELVPKERAEVAMSSHWANVLRLAAMELLKREIRSGGITC